jgi:hypothetical protein
MPLVTCMMPCPQSNDILAGPVEFHQTVWSACAVLLSIQLAAFSRTGGM